MTRTHALLSVAAAGILAGTYALASLAPSPHPSSYVPPRVSPVPSHQIDLHPSRPCSN